MIDNDDINLKVNIKEERTLRLNALHIIINFIYRSSDELGKKSLLYLVIS